MPEANELNSGDELEEVDRIVPQDVTVMVRTGSNPGVIPVDEGFDRDSSSNQSNEESKFGSNIKIGADLEGDGEQQPTEEQDPSALD